MRTIELLHDSDLYIAATALLSTLVNEADYPPALSAYLDTRLETTDIQALIVGMYSDPFTLAQVAAVIPWGSNHMLVLGDTTGGVIDYCSLENTEDLMVFSTEGVLTKLFSATVATDQGNQMQVYTSKEYGQTQYTLQYRDGGVVTTVGVVQARIAEDQDLGCMYIKIDKDVVETFPVYGVRTYVTTFTVEVAHEVYNTYTYKTSGEVVLLPDTPESRASVASLILEGIIKA